MSDGYTPGYKPPYVGVNSGKTDNSPHPTDWTALRHQYAGQFMAALVMAGHQPSVPGYVRQAVKAADEMIAALKETEHD